MACTCTVGVINKQHRKWLPSSETFKDPRCIVKIAHGTTDTRRQAKRETKKKGKIKTSTNFLSKLFLQHFYCECLGSSKPKRSVYRGAHRIHVSLTTLKTKRTTLYLPVLYECCKFGSNSGALRKHHLHRRRRKSRNKFVCFSSRRFKRTMPEVRRSSRWMAVDLLQRRIGARKRARKAI